MWPVVGTGIENRSASSQLDCLGCLATGVICEAVFMSSGYFCGFSNSFFLRMEKEQAVIITSSVMEFQRCVLLPSMEHAFLGLF